MIVWVAVTDFGGTVHVFADGSEEEVKNLIRKAFPNAKSIHWESELYDIEHDVNDTLHVVTDEGCMYVNSYEVK